MESFLGPLNHWSVVHMARYSFSTQQSHSKCPWAWDRGLKGFRKNTFIAAWRILIIHRTVFFHHETLSLGCGFDPPLASLCILPVSWAIGLSACLMLFDSQWLISWGVIISLTFILEAWACLSGWQWAVRSYSITDRQFNLFYPNPFVLPLSSSRWPLQ